MAAQFANLLLLLLAATCSSHDISVTAKSPPSDHLSGTEPSPQKRLYPPFGDDLPPLNHRQIDVVQDVPESGPAATLGAQHDENDTLIHAPNITAEPREPTERKVQSPNQDYARYADISWDYLGLVVVLSNSEDDEPPSQAPPVSDSALVTVADVERVARLKLEPQARRYFFSGSDRQQTLKENTEAFKRLRFRPKLLVDVSKVDTTTTVLGHRISMPIGFSPTALQKLAHNDGEVATAQAAQDARIVMILSSLSTTTLEEVRTRAPRALLWFQAYLFRDRSVTEWLVKRAAKAGYSAIVLTADSPVVGHKLGPVKNRFDLPPNVTFANLQGRNDKSKVQSGNQENVDQSISRSVSWEDIGWLKRITGLPVVVKGLLTPRNCDRFSIIYTNGKLKLPAKLHQTASEISTWLRDLRLQIDFVQIICGADVVKALSLGARAVFLGRPAIWGLAYNGKKGVDRVLDILRSELERTMQLLGCKNSSSLNSAYVVHKDHYARTRWKNYPRHEL
ncbi:hypothetical protein HPB51_009952 [Rhipicephalus microplus]|uniref:FMN hydroxy acid dehydrogenase domain-containing protein n=1 Tax=Rhipicephalus microplus TaxID=6941 RepID=A0A9J6ET94_RHIMP|nr:hypothetical protein HPB51_009952 [Rhipicephalus microplus]